MNINAFKNIQEQFTKLNLQQNHLQGLQIQKYFSSGQSIDGQNQQERKHPLNILGEKLQPCSYEPVTGFMRDGYCKMTPYDYGYHVVCAKMTERFLINQKEHGNDLITPRGNFNGLKPGDKWCLCATRYRDAVYEGVAPQIDVEATDQTMLKFVDKKVLVENSVRNVFQTIKVLDF